MFWAMIVPVVGMIHHGPYRDTHSVDLCLSSCGLQRYCRRHVIRLNNVIILTIMQCMLYREMGTEKKVELVVQLIMHYAREDQG